ncbi:MAG: hypothetical protein JW841_00600 [Deltaproteobacteria bacterium]|nr:hypothetical protein [Deltaproteobacteria bacterium]
MSSYIIGSPDKIIQANDDPNYFDNIFKKNPQDLHEILIREIICNSFIELLEIMHIYYIVRQQTGRDYMFIELPKHTDNFRSLLVFNDELVVNGKPFSKTYQEGDAIPVNNEIGIIRILNNEKEESWSNRLKSFIYPFGAGVIMGVSIVASETLLIPALGGVASGLILIENNSLIHCMERDQIPHNDFYFERPQYCITEPKNNGIRIFKDKNRF